MLKGVVIGMPELFERVVASRILVGIFAVIIRVFAINVLVVIGLTIVVILVLYIILHVLSVHSVPFFLLVQYVFAIAHTLIVANGKKEYAVYGEYYAENCEKEISARSIGLEKCGKKHYLHEEIDELNPLENFA